MVVKLAAPPHHKKYILKNAFKKKILLRLKEPGQREEKSHFFVLVRRPLPEVRLTRKNERVAA